MKKLSLKDIARTLGVSAASVSYVLNGKAKEKRISLDLEKKILQYVKLHNFQPNQLAKSLRTGKSRIICLMVEDIADTFFASVAGHIEDLAFEKGYKIVYCSTKNDTKKAKELIRTFRERNVDGYIITPPQGIEDDLLALMGDNIPVILFDRYYQGINSSYVGMDNMQSTYDATRHLIGQNYKNIAFVTLDSNQVQMKDRLSGYTKAVKKLGKKPVVVKVPYASRFSEEAITTIENLFRTNPETDALFFGTNYLATSGLEALNRLNLKLVTDVGMIVFDDNDLFRVHVPTITAVTQPVHEMSIQMINLLLDQIKHGGKYTTQQIVVPASLAIRQSSIAKSPKR